MPTKARSARKSRATLTSRTAAPRRVEVREGFELVVEEFTPCSVSICMGNSVGGRLFISPDWIPDLIDALRLFVGPRADRKADYRMTGKSSCDLYALSGDADLVPVQIPGLEEWDLAVATLRYPSNRRCACALVLLNEGSPLVLANGRDEVEVRGDMKANVERHGAGFVSGVFCELLNRRREDREKRALG